MCVPISAAPCCKVGVTHFYAEDKLTYAVSDGKAYSVDPTISDLEKKLDPKKFFRIHRGRSGEPGLDTGSRVASRRNVEHSPEGREENRPYCRA